MPKPQEIIEGELINEFAKVYRMKDGRRGVAILPKGFSDGRLTLDFTPRGRKTFRAGVAAVIRLDMAQILLRDMPTFFELLKEMPEGAK
jgi:hypothetical protein